MRRTQLEPPPRTATSAACLAGDMIRAAMTNLQGARRECESLEVWGPGPPDANSEAAKVIAAGVVAVVKQLADYESMLAGVLVSLRAAEGK